MAWRAKGEATVPPALVAFFLFIAACFGVLEWGVNSWSLSRISAEDRVEVTAIVREYREPAWWHPVGSPQFVVETPAGTPLQGLSRSIEVPAETDRAVDVGDEVPLEVHRSRPELARLVWTAEVWRDDRDFGRVSTFVCLGLAALSALALLFEQAVLRRSA